MTNCFPGSTARWAKSLPENAERTTAGGDNPEFMERAIPILPAEGLRAARAFYVDWLGFRCHIRNLTGWPIGIARVERGGIRLTLDSPMTGHGRNACVGFEVDDANALYREWSAKVNVLRAPEDEDWGARTFDLLDPSGNTIFVVGPRPAIAIEIRAMTAG